MEDFITVSEAMEINLIPEPWHSEVPTHCSSCGTELKVNSALTVLRCTNKECPRRIAKRILKLFDILGYKGWGEKTAETAAIALKYKSITDVIANPPPPWFDIKADLQAKQYDYAQLVKALAIPHFGEKALRLFSKYNNIEEFIEVIDKSNKSPVQFIAEELGGQIVAVNVYNIILEYLDELEKITELITPLPHISKVIPIAITGYISMTKFEDGRAMTKDQYIDYLNSITMPFEIKFQRSDALKSVMFVVADAPSNSHKYNIGRQRGILANSANLVEVAKRLTRI